MVNHLTNDTWEDPMPAASELFSEPIFVRLRGPIACFTMSGTRAEPFSLPVIPPTAAIGAIENIMWKPEIEYRINRVILLKNIRRSTICTNGAANKATYLSRTNIIDPVQRNLTVLRDVDYIIDCSMRIKDASRQEHGIEKYKQQLLRRLREGRCFRDPCLGKRTFLAEFGDVYEGDLIRPAPINLDIGMIPHQRIWSAEKLPGQKRSARIERDTYFHARIVDGVMRVPH